MTISLAFALLCLAPSAAVMGCYPRRQWAAGAAVLMATAAGLGLLAWVPVYYQGQAVAVAAWSLAACFYALYLCRRDMIEHEQRDERLQRLRLRNRETAASLEETKTKGKEAGREQKETQALYGVIKGLSEVMTWEEIRPKIELAVDQYLGVEHFALYAADMRADEEFHPLTIRVGTGSLGGSWAAIARYLQEHSLTPSQPHVIEKPEPAIALPIQENGELLGYFYARVPEGGEAAALLAKAWTFAYEISFAFRRVRLFQEVERLSRIDGLTGVYRRGDFEEKLQEEAIRAKTFKTTFGLMLLDIDHFKKLNDRYGHPFGDQVLRRVGEILNGLVYDTDFVARYGGEEFVIVLPRAEPAGALRKAEAIRRAIESEPFSIALENVGVTVSIGLAHFPRDAASPHELISVSDQAMYQAKSQGRNRVVDHASLRDRA